jgi:hypothetical protein
MGLPTSDEMRTLLEMKAELEEGLAEVEKQIYEVEEQYISETPHGQPAVALLAHASIAPEKSLRAFLMSP